MTPDERRRFHEAVEAYAQAPYRRDLATEARIRAAFPTRPPERHGRRWTRWRRRT